MESARSRWLVLVAVLVAVSVSFLPALDGEFVLDDDYYVERNELIRVSSAGDVGRIFRSFVVGNYHPLTVLSLALDHRLGGTEPFVYHVTNLLFHLLNVFLVHVLVWRLSGSTRAAWVAALLFGIHPLRVESVAWISSRKDVLYAFFYLLSLIAYVRHASARRLSWPYWASLVFFLFSLLSKGMAVSLSLVLPLLDYLAGRRPSTRTVLEKVPFFALSLVFGVVAIWVQQSSGATVHEVIRPLADKLQLASFGLVFYLAKLMLPVQLSAFYPYPEHPPGALPVSFLVYPLILLGLAAGVIYSARYTRQVVFGALFFLLNVVFVLQVLPVGGAVAADRYTYVASVGLAYLVGVGYARLPSAGKHARIAIVAVLLIAALLGYGTYRRCAVWQDKLTLFSDVIAKYPGFHLARETRGMERAERGDLAGAIADFDEAIRLRPDHARTYANRANAKADLGDRKGALDDYDRAIELAPDYAEAHYNRGYLLGEIGDVRGAIEGMTAAIRLAPGLVAAYLNRGDAYRWAGEHDKAIPDYTAVLELEPNNAAAYHGRAISLYRTGQPARALADLRRASALGFPVADDVRRSIEAAAR